MDNKLRIAVVFDGDLLAGGGYQQQLSTLLKLKELGKYEFVGVAFKEENKKIVERYNFECILIKENILNKIYRYIFRQEWFYRFARKFRLKTKFEKILLNNNVDLVYFLSPSIFSLDLVFLNYIITVWDLCHRDFPEFPEVNFNREFENREFLYTRSLKKAVAVLVDSWLGKENVARRYGIDGNRIYVAPFSPSINAFVNNHVDVKSKYGIDGEYIYYPAQFWAHKNHVYIIDALSILKSEGIKITAVFSGSDKGNLAYVLNYARDKGVDKLVKYIGFAPNEEINSLYKNALALVMPTYFGPTNMPPLEAFAIGIPVIYPDLEDLRDQVGDAALLCNLKNPETLANHLIELKNSEDLRNELIAKGKKRLKELEQINVSQVLNQIFEEYSIKLKCWK